MKKLVKLLTLTLCMALLISYVPSKRAPVVTSNNTITTGAASAGHSNSNISIRR